MNKSEKKAYEWLIKFGNLSDPKTYKAYTELDIIYQARKSPTFICKNGEKFEVKRLYGNKVLFHKKRFEELKRMNSCTLLVMTDEEQSPTLMVPISDLEENKIIDGIQITIIEQNKTDNNYVIMEEIKDLIEENFSDSEQKEHVLAMIEDLQGIKIKDKKYWSTKYPLFDFGGVDNQDKTIKEVMKETYLKRKKEILGDVVNGQK